MLRCFAMISVCWAATRLTTLRAMGWIHLLSNRVWAASNSSGGSRRSHKGFQNSNHPPNAGKCFPFETGQNRVEVWLLRVLFLLIHLRITCKWLNRFLCSRSSLLQMNIWWAGKKSITAFRDMHSVTTTENPMAGWLIRYDTIEEINVDSKAEYTA